MNKLAFVIPVRMNSSRLPGKCCLKIFKNFSLIQIVVSRLKYFFPEIPIVIATSKKSSDDYLVYELEQYDVSIFRGELDNVASRFVKISEKFDYLIRVNGDNVYLEKKYIETAINYIYNDSYNFITNVQKRTFPIGNSVEIVKSSFLIKKYTDFNSNHLEHVFTYFYENWCHKIMKNIKNKTDMSNVNLAIDNSEDLINAIKYYKSIGNILTSFNINKYNEIITLPNS